MNRLCQRFLKQLKESYQLDGRTTVIAYGSNIYDEINKSSDLDLCLITEKGTIIDRCKSKLFKDVERFLVENGLSLDPDIPISNKLVFSKDEVEGILRTSPFLDVTGRHFWINRIKKEQEYLSSSEMRKRLLLNLLTTEHVVLNGDQKEVESWSERAMLEVLIAVKNMNNLKTLDESIILPLLYSNDVNDMHGESYLGYKTGNENKMRYLQKEVIVILKKVTKFKGVKND